MAEETGVTPAETLPAEAVEQTEPVSAPVSGESLASDRPVQNVVAEMNRKFAKLQSQYETLMQYVATQSQSRPAAPAKGEPTDEELFSLMQQGDKAALDLYVDRRAARAGQVQVRQLEQEQLVGSQLAILASRYPVLNDAAHPLTQQTTATYQALLARGYPASRATLLEAVKTAITDRPDLVAELQSKVSPAPLRRDRAQSGVTGVTTREEPSTGSQSKPVSKAEADLARRMGIKDPAKAKERFYQRQAGGQSSIADTLHPFVREE